MLVVNFKQGGGTFTMDVNNFFFEKSKITSKINFEMVL